MAGVPTFPRIDVIIRGDATGEVTIQGNSYPVPPSGDVHTARLRAIGVVTLRAAIALGRPVQVTAHDPEGTWPLVVHPNGHVEGTGADLGAPLPRPAVAAIQLRTADGQVSKPGTSILVGRNPQPKTAETVSVLFAIRDPGRELSKTHARIDVGLCGTVTVADRDSTNGTAIQLHGTRRPVPGYATMIVPNAAVILLAGAVTLEVATP